MLYFINLFNSYHILVVKLLCSILIFYCVPGGFVMLLDDLVLLTDIKI